MITQLMIFGLVVAGVVAGGWYLINHVRWKLYIRGVKGEGMQCALCRPIIPLGEGAVTDGTSVFCSECGRVGIGM